MKLTKKKEQEILNLRDAVKKRTAELEIESALEKVRTVAMGMKRPEDMLKVCRTISKQLKLLGTKDIRNVQTAIFNNSNTTYLNYEYFPEKNKTIITEIDYTLQPDVKAFAKKMMKARDTFFTKSFKGAEIKKWNQYQKKTNQYIDPRQNKATSLQYCFYSIGNGALGISAFAPLSKNEIQIFKRFRNVFELAYKRFVDIQKAEAQAKEARIEAALEKVRSEAMGMRKADDMLEICKQISKQLASLGIKEIRNIQTAIFYEQRGSYMNYQYYAKHNKTFITDTLYTDHKIARDFATQMLKGKGKFYITHIKGKKVKDWVAYQKTTNVFIDKYLYTAPSLSYYWYSLGPVALGISTYYPLTVEEENLFKRFLNVFELAYRRYLDIEKAEAQAKEAKIELGLERVRARAMAMQNSNELAELVSVVFKELTHLDFTLTSCIIWISDTETLANTLWVTSAKMNKPAEPVRLKTFQHSFFHSIIHAWKEKDPKWIYTLSGKEKKSFEKAFFANEPRMPVALKKALSVPREVVFSASFNNFGALEILGTEQLTDEKFEILHRFGKVFNSSYTRFNDLKKAEAQAREAQIEVAVERVRAKALAMHNSKQIMEVVAALKNEMLGLEIPGVVAATIYLQAEDRFVRMWDLTSVIKMEEGFQVTLDVKFRLDETDPDLFIRKVWNSDEKYFVVKQEAKDMAITLEWLKKYNAEEADNAKKFFEANEWKYVLHPTVQLAHGKMSVDIFDTAPPVEMESIMLKMGSAFDLAYKRFLDLQKAELQAKEAQIELSLERVRARTMAMHKSDELAEVVRLLYKQFEELDFGFYQVLVSIYDKKKNIIEWWSRGYGDIDLPQRNIIPMIDHPFPNDLFEKWANGVEYYPHILEGEIKKSWDEYLFTQTDLKHFPQEIKDTMRSFDRVYLSDVFMKYGALQAAGPAPLPDDKADILKRFTKVLDLAYTRMTDLLNAEAQAREAKIEAALERVRSRTNAMHRSENLHDVIEEVNDQLQQLGFRFDAADFLTDYSDKGYNIWVVNFQTPVYVPAIDHKLFNLLKEVTTRGDNFFTFILTTEEKNIHFKNIFENTVAKNAPEELKQYIYNAKGMATSCVVLKNIMLSVTNFATIPYTDEENEILKRFAYVFEQSYTRFLDLQKVEEQGREAQIELALERVRARTMAMQKSDELADAAQLLYREFGKLCISTFTCGYMFIDEARQTQTGWFVLPDGSFLPNFIVFPLTGDHVLDSRYKDWKEKKPLHIYEIQDEVNKEHHRFLSNYVPPFVKEDIFSKIPDRIIFNCANFSDGYLLILSTEHFSPKEQQTIVRFAKVFEQTYTRFLDLQKAEAQAKEAQIEAALERVRSRTMAMHKSEELPGAASLLFQQIQILGMPAFAAGYCIWEDEKQAITLWMSSEGVLQPPFKAPTTEDELFIQMRKGYEDGQSLHVVQMGGEELVAHYRYMRTLPVVGDIFDSILEAGHPLPVFQVMHYAYFSKGFLLIITYEPVPDAHAIFKRFAAVFEQTYTRFLDLQKAEAQTREALIEAALERVRARALAMQQPEELKEVAEVLRYEMGLLGVEELETSSIYINDVNAEKAECWYALKDIRSNEKILVNDHFALDLNDTWVGRQMLQFYDSSEKQTSIVMQGENRKEWIRYCEEKSVPFRGYYGEVIPDRTYHLYKFSHGAIGAASASDISAESWKLLSRAASVFSLAYSRFKDLTQARNDLIQLKEEKKRAEDALTELQVTQKQLIQAEKMASLGELTAGIAHEIQNPLNFVNNFSDVSKELLDEMKAELDKGNTEDAKEIANDVIQNLEKINHHGKRADGIVKGMLQHSRTGSGQKELTDINSLCDEYLRLAYHGLRAKDKSFNAKFETELDNSIGKVNIIPQDIGRVLVNLINNAFYAVSEKLKHASTGSALNGYEPFVIVTSKKNGDRVVLSVKDNGNGIPQKVVDKIFQPFFTTKPTGQGTGLGLSLSYDIVKSHGGELLVETKEGEGTEFIISLPVNQ